MPEVTASTTAAPVTSSAVGSARTPVPRCSAAQAWPHAAVVTQAAYDAPSTTSASSVDASLATTITNTSEAKICA
ncbi:unannotated protein [freshwater metagenome]|uniref:Unannotated protein n=1 Tax=freshwater metagenome TaxID=449393 RepID=A0A6J6PPI9_9ZZZZ